MKELIGDYEPFVAGISVKFHEQQLGAVVRIENRLKENGFEKYS